MGVIRQFFQDDPSGYVGVSWGKDSVVTAHLVWRAMGDRVPVVWVREEPHKNPFCLDVRDAFFALCPHKNYHEIVVQYSHDEMGWHATGTMELGFKTSRQMFGDRHVSGVRGKESSIRELVMKRWGTSTDRTARPIGWWSGEDVFAYLEKHNLPVHPAYAMSMGGLHTRSRLRVCCLGGERGTMFNRRELEETYYRPEIEAITQEWERLTGLKAGSRWVL